MSADNYLSIEPEGDKWAVWEKNASTDMGGIRKVFKDKLAAIEYAEKIQRNEIIEYGLSITLASDIKPKGKSK